MACNRLILRSDGVARDAIRIQMNPNSLSTSKPKQTIPTASILTYFDSPDSPRNQLSIAPSLVSNALPQRVRVSPVCGLTTYSDGYIETPI